MIRLPFRIYSFIAALAIAGALGALPTACRDAKQPPPTADAHGATAAIPVKLAPVRREARAAPLRATGMLAAKSQVKASFKIGGVVASIAVAESAAVKRGQVLATLTPTEIDAGVDQARQGLAKAERDLARAKELFAGKAATQEQLDDATTGLELARAQLRAVQFNRQHAVIRAPSDGRVLKRLAEPGEVVGPGQPILVLAGTTAGYVVRVGVADRDVVRLSTGDGARARFFAWPDQAYDGVVTELAANASPATGTFEIEVAFDGLPPSARVGMIAELTLRPATTQPIALVPAAALRDGEEHHATIWSPDPSAGAGAAQAHRVEIAFFDGELAAIASGLDGVDQVIADGAAYLTPGATIAVVP